MNKTIYCHRCKGEYAANSEWITVLRDLYLLINSR